MKRLTFLICWRYKIKLNRYSWKKKQSERIKQLILRLLPLVFILILSGGIVWIFRSADLRARLDDSVFEIVSSRTFQAVEDYFNPLLELVSSSVLWSRIGEVDSLGDPGNYIELLENRLEYLGTVSSFSISEQNGRELNLLLSQNADSLWSITDNNSTSSLSFMRESNGIKYLRIEGPEPDSDSNFRISTPYLIPNIEIPGITMRLDIRAKSDIEGITISFDLPLSRMLNRLHSKDSAEDAVIFLLMPSKKDFIILPVKDLLIIDEKMIEDGLLNITRGFDGEIEELIKQISSEEEQPGNGDVRFRFTSENKEWLAEFTNIKIGNESLSMGTIIPEEALWTSQVSGPLQIILLALLTSIGFLILRLLQDYSMNAQSPFKLEEQVRAEIAKGESYHLEFKSSLRWDYREDKVNKSLEEIIVKSIAAFNNADGGTLLIGIGDAGEVLGIEKDYGTLKETGKDYFEIHLRNLLSAKYGVGYTSNNISIDFPWLSGHEICRIRIKRGKQPLYTMVKSKSGAQVEKFFIRSGNTSQVLDKVSEITSYILTRFSRSSMRNRRG